MASLISISATSLASEPDAKNNLPLRPNPTATVTGVCYKLDQKDYSQFIHATCYSERKRAVVVLVSGNAGKISGQKIAEHITNELSKSYVPAVAFLDMPDWEKVAITYFLNGDSYGPYSGKNWKDGKKILTLHSAQAWHQKSP